MTADFAQTQILNLERERATLAEQIAASQARLPVLDAQIASLKPLLSADPKPVERPAESKVK